MLLIACGTSVDLGGGGGGGAHPEGGEPTSCVGFAAPAVHAQCTDCTFDCQANGCYDGWYCDLSTHDCQPPCTACGRPGPDCHD